MRLDDQGHAAVLAFLQVHGYAGTLGQWLDEMERQSYPSKVRIFDSRNLSGLGEEFLNAQTFVRQVLAGVQGRFDAVRVRDGYGKLFIDFSIAAARRQARRVRPLKIDGLALDIEQDEDSVVVRCRLYVNTEFRRDRYFRFPSQAPTSTSKGRK